MTATRLSHRLLPLVLIVCVVIAGFGLVIIRHQQHNNLQKKLNHQTHNATAKMLLGQTIVDNLRITSDCFRSFLIAENKHEKALLRDRALLFINEIDNALDIFNHGGVLHKKILLNVPGMDEKILHIQYQAEKNHGYILEILTLKPQLDELREKLNQIFSDHGHDLPRRSKKIDSLLVRMLENSNKLTFDARTDLHRLHTQVATIGDESMKREQQWALLGSGGVLLLIMLIFKQIMAHRNALESSVSKLKLAQTDLQEKNRLILEFNESLEQQVALRTKKLELSEQQWQDAFDAVHSPIFLHDENGNIIKANQAYAKAAQISLTGMIGRPYWQVFPKQQNAMPGCLERTNGQHSGCAEDLELFIGNRIYRSQSFAVHGETGDHIYSLHLLDDQTEKYQLTQLLQEKEKHFRALFDKAPVAYMSLNIDGEIIDVNEAWLEMTGHSKSMISNNRFSSFVDHEDQPELQRYLVQLYSSGILRGKTLRMLCANGSQRLVSIEARLTYNDQGEISQSHFILFDITQQAEQDATLRLAAKVFDSTTEGIMVTDTLGIIVAVNAAFSTITGYTDEEICGKKPSILQSDRQNDEFYQQMWQQLEETGQWRGEIWNQRKNGETYPQWMTIDSVENNDGQLENYVAVFSDISSMKSAIAQLEHQAHYHPLTELPNRLLLYARLKHSIQRSQREDSKGAVLFIDLDNFKNINDSMGHAAGDEVLKEVAKRIVNDTRKVDTLAHLSGDEFVLVMDQIKSIDDVTANAQRVLDALQPAFTVKNYELFLSASIGISIFPDDGIDAENLLKNADAAMYKAKTRGKNRYHIYSPELTENIKERIQLESDLRKALERQQFVIYYQPQVTLTPGRALSAEALVRWKHPELGLIPPDKFIPLSEETGLILPLGEWVLRCACQQFVDLNANGYPLQRISVNLSGRQIQNKQLPQLIEQILHDTGCPAHCLELEITESFVMQHLEQAINVLSQIKALGVELAVDDFGTGHSSLSYLKRLPIHRLKIDRSFVSDIRKNPEGEAIIKAIIAMSKSLNLALTAEGIETRAQFEFLQNLGCDEAQGYLISRPLPIAEFETFIKSTQQL